MIVLWGLPNDGPISRVHDILLQKNIPTLFIDQQDELDYTFEMTFDSDKVSGVICSPYSSVKIEDVHAIYLRPYDLRQLGMFERCDSTDEAWMRAAYFEDTMLLWSEITNVLVINKPSFGGSNASKPYQLELIRQCGLKVPATILTTIPQEVKDFRLKYGRVIYKSISCQRSIVAELDNSDDERLKDVTWCPTQFQEYINGIDYRVHILEERIFVSKILSSATDYRYGGDAQIELVTLPSNIEEKCFHLTRSLGLHFAGIDLRQSYDGEWYCFEVNPSPGYTYYEDVNDRSISHALVEYLARS
jgi:glutathione synthase/RimK-type ligase-like ATP-grasp enzyme